MTDPLVIRRWRKKRKSKTIARLLLRFFLRCTFDHRAAHRFTGSRRFTPHPFPRPRRKRGCTRVEAWEWELVGAADWEPTQSRRLQASSWASFLKLRRCTKTANAFLHVMQRQHFPGSCPMIRVATNAPPYCTRLCALGKHATPSVIDWLRRFYTRPRVFTPARGSRAPAGRAGRGSRDCWQTMAANPSLNADSNG